MTFLLDVNLLMAVLWENHEHHQTVRAWLRRGDRFGRIGAMSRLCANTDPQRNSLLTKGPAHVRDYASSEMALGREPGIDAAKKLPGEGFKRPGPPLIKMDEAMKVSFSTRSSRRKEAQIERAESPKENSPGQAKRRPGSTNQKEFKP